MTIDEAVAKHGMKQLQRFVAWSPTLLPIIVEKGLDPRQDKSWELAAKMAYARGWRP